MNDPQANRIVEAVKDFGDVPAAYATLMDLGTVFMRNNLQVVNGLNASVSLKFASGETGENIVTIQAGATRDFKQLKMYGIIQYQYESGAPGSGTLTTSAW